MPNAVKNKESGDNTPDSFYVEPVEEFDEYEEFINFPNAQGRTVEQAQKALLSYNRRNANKCMLAEKSTGNLYEIIFESGEERKLSGCNLCTKLTTREFAWRVPSKKKNPVYRQPSKSVFESLATASITDKQKIPVYRGVHHGALLRLDGTIVAKRGYDAETRLVLLSNINVDEVPENPTEEQIAEIKRMFLSIFGDFKFKRDSDEDVEDSVPYQNTIFMLFAAVLRSSWKGAYPVFVIDKPSERLGGSLLANCISKLAFNQDAPMKAFSQRKDENEKRFDAILKESPAFCSIDNVTADSDWVCPALLTATTGGANAKVDIREMGSLNVIHAEPRTVFCVNGINVTLSADITGRVVVINLRSNEAWQKLQFEHMSKDEFLKYVESMHPKIMWGFATMIRYWNMKGSPLPAKPSGNFSEYSDLYDYIGGVMTACGYTRFLGNLAEIQTTHNDRENDGKKVVDLLYKRFGNRDFTLGDLHSELMGVILLRETEVNYDFEEDLASYILTQQQIASIKTLNPRTLGNAFSRFINKPFYGSTYAIAKRRTNERTYYWLTTDLSEKTNKYNDIPTATNATAKEEKKEGLAAWV